MKRSILLASSSKLNFLNLLLLALFFITQLASANQNNIRFHRYSLEQGLSQEAVLDIIQDKNGFMWFATQEGINRFDGYQFRAFNHDPSNSNSLSHDAINSVIEDHQGILWLGTEVGGLNRFDPVNETFSHYRKSTHQLSSDRINTIFEDSNHTLWVGTDGGGLNRFDESTQTFKVFRHNKANTNSLNNDTIRAIHQDQQGRLWVGTDFGLNLYDPKTESFVNFIDNKQAPTAIKQGGITSIFSDKQQRLWVGTYENGLIRIDSDNVFFHYQHNEDESTSLAHNWVRNIIQDNDDMIWIATDDGLSLWQADKNNFLRFQHDEQDLYSITDSRTISLYQDKGGVLWLGTFGGVNKWTSSSFAHYRQDQTNAHSVSSNIITSFAENQQGEIWVGTYDGLNLYDPKTKLFNLVKSDPNQKNSLSDNRIMSLKNTTDNTLWIGTQGKGVDHYNPSTGKIINYHHDTEDPQSISGDGITDIFEDNQGVLWIAAYDEGINKFNRQSGVFERLSHDPSDVNTLASNRVLSIYQTQDGLFWFGTEGGGLDSFDSNTGKFTHFLNQENNPDSLSSNVAWSILEDNQGDLWIGTWGGGLNRWRGEDRKAGIVRFKHYGRKQGLLSTMIYDIVADPQGVLWISSNRGLTKFDPTTEQFTQYDVSHGLQGNEFNLKAAFISSKGQMFFGGSNGFNAFYADKIANNLNQPLVVLTGMQKLNKQTGMVDVTLSDNLTFGYQDYAISFDFAGLDYTAPHKNSYQYKLEGFDQDWVDVGKSRRTTFTNLPSDDYIFRVKAANNDGVWSEQGLAIKIKVTPPPWKTWWAYILYTLFISSILFAIYRAQAKKLREKAEYSKHLEEQVAQRTSELTTANEALETAKTAAEAGNQAKGTFIATMSHELRTPMTSIIGFAESILEDMLEKTEIKRRTGKIISNANHLLQLMNDVLDISKIEVQHLDIELIPVLPAVVLQELDELIGQQARKKQLSFDIEYQFPFPVQIQGDPTRLKQILLNLCNNAIKFTEKGGIKIKVSADKQKNQLHFIVEDTGIGIPENKFKTVFEAFSQADSSTTRKYGGTGLGLSIAKQLSQAMGGEMTLDSEEGKGSQFSFYIDMGDPAPDDWLNDHQEVIDLQQKNNLREFNVPNLKGHILLAEDWPDNQELIRMYIERTGAKVTLVENGQLAVETAMVEDFDLILMDIQMPEMDGIEATQMLRAVGFSKPIIALTANVSKSDITQYLSSGFTSHLSKPIERNNFYQELASILPSISDENALSGKSQDEEYVILVQNFVTKLPDIMNSIEQAVEQLNWQELSALLHNLKGLGGSFGFPEITELAGPMYESIVEGQPNLSKFAELKQITDSITQDSKKKIQ